MCAVVNYGPEARSVETREIPTPELGETDVLLEVEAVGICGSDVHQWLGLQSWHVNYPCTLGHEFCGKVVETGPAAERFRKGDRVVSETSAVIDENSPMTRQGLYNLDPSRLGFGYGTDGAMANYAKTPERCLHRVPDGLGPVIASMTEPCCVAYNAVCMNTRIRAGDSVLVIGPGTIGLLCAHLAKLSGAGHLVVCGTPADAARLQIAGQLGADVALTEGVAEHVKSIGDGLGVDVVVDAAGISATLELAIQAVRPAGQVAKVGWGRDPLDFSIDPVVQKNVTVQGSFSHNWPIWERVLAMLASGQLAIEPIISRVASLDDWEECFERMHAGEYLKAVLKPNG